MKTHMHRLFLAVTFVTCINQRQLVGQTLTQFFVSVTPCRIADTRAAYGGSGPISGGQTQNFTVGGVCNVPSTAAAYSVNITAVPPAGRPLQYLTLYPAGTALPNASTLNDYLGTVVANAAIVQAGNGGKVSVYVSDTSDVIIDIDGYFLPQTNVNDSTAFGTGALASNTGYDNTAVGVASLAANTSGINNTGTGYQSLLANTTGGNNSAFGVMALAHNTTGSDNVAVGYSAALNNSSGSQNVAIGSSAGSGFGGGNGNIAIGYQTSTAPETDTSYTIAVGYQALSNNTGNFNTAIGYQALQTVTSGTSNIALGPSAGSLVTTGSNNIEIGNTGTSTDNGFIRIGTAGTQNSTYIAGISGTTVTGAAVLINSSGQLGVQSSSIRYKEDVHDMADASDRLMKLRPVQFHYKQPEADGSKPVQFGLVAEEVAQVYPELVVRGKDGLVDTVQYHQLPAMLLNHIQKQRRTITDQQKEIAAQQQTIAGQQQELKDLKVEMESLRAMILSR